MAESTSGDVKTLQKCNVWLQNTATKRLQNISTRLYTYYLTMKQ